MRNYLKKISALFIVLAMAVGMCMTAAADTATITITNNSGVETTYYILQLIEPDTSSSTGWKFTSDEIAGVIAAAIADGDTAKALEYLTGDSKDSYIEAAITAVANYSNITSLLGSAVATTSATTVDITVNSAGLYYIKAVASGMAYNPMAVYVEYDYSTNPATLKNASLNAKSTEISVDKASDQTDNITEIGETVTYTIETTVPYIPTYDNDRYFYVSDSITGAQYVTDGTNVIITVTDSNGNILYASDGVTPLTYTVTTETYDSTTKTQSFVADLSVLLDNYANTDIIITYPELFTAI